MNGNVNIELSRQELKNLFCATWNLMNLYEEDKLKEISKEEFKQTFGREKPAPCDMYFCENCKFLKECSQNGIENTVDFHECTKILTRLTGIIFSPLVGAKECGNPKLINENLINQDILELLDK